MEKVKRILSEDKQRSMVAILFETIVKGTFNDYSMSFNEVDLNLVIKARLEKNSLMLILPAPEEEEVRTKLLLYKGEGSEKNSFILETDFTIVGWGEILMNIMTQE